MDTSSAEALGTITSAAQAVKAVVEAIKAARTKAKGNAEALAALVEAHELALSLQSSLFEAKEQAFTLQEENRQLRAQVREHEARALDREGYERRQLGEATVYVPKDSPKTLLCATCFERDTKSYLSRLPAAARQVGSHLCPTCEAVLTIPVSLI